eukprot:12914018-Prorocentrum_lima.AAC.1
MQRETHRMRLLPGKINQGPVPWKKHPTKKQLQCRTQCWIRKRLRWTKSVPWFAKPKRAPRQVAKIRARI